MASYEIIMQVDLPNSATRLEIQEWVYYVTGVRAGIAVDHPFGDKELQARWATIHRVGG